ncbi:hypothetical protein FDECE_3436 [Fusarium decemcellulare]|nr:hypothetical protein FDECE_3436 [Fusarium decemcellulare]
MVIDEESDDEYAFNDYDVPQKPLGSAMKGPKPQSQSTLRRRSLAQNFQPSDKAKEVVALMAGSRVQYQHHNYIYAIPGPLSCHPKGWDNQARSPNEGRYGFLWKHLNWENITTTAQLYAIHCHLIDPEFYKSAGYRGLYEEANSRVINVGPRGDKSPSSDAARGVKTYKFASIRRPEKVGIVGQPLPYWHNSISYEVVLPTAPNHDPKERQDAARLAGH